MNRSCQKRAPNQQYYSGIQNLEEDFKKVALPIQSKGTIKIVFQNGSVVDKKIELDGVDVESVSNNVAVLNLDGLFESVDIEYPIMVVSSQEVEERNAALYSNVLHEDTQKSGAMKFHSDVFICGEICLCYAIPIKEMNTKATPVGIMEGETKEDILGTERAVRIDNKYYDNQKEISRRED